MNKLKQVDIIQAQPGFFPIYINDNDTKFVATDEPILAWRYETYELMNDKGFYSACIPLTVSGEPGDNCIGIQGPNMIDFIFDWYKASFPETFLQ